MQKVPFNPEKEMQYVGSYKEIVETPSGKKVENTPKLNAPVSIKENHRLLIDEKAPLWMLGFSDKFSFNPIDFPDNVARAFVSDLAPFDKVKDGGGLDWFGVEWEYMPSAGGSMVKPGNPKVKDLEHWEDYITIPDPKKLDWDAMVERNKSIFDDERPVTLTFFTGLFERLISFVDFEDAALSMIDEDEQEHVHRLFGKLTDFYIELLTLSKQHFPIDMLVFHDDWGSQRAPFFSLDTCREMLVPYVKRIADACHSMGMWYQSHSCGKNEMLLPAYIEAGVDVWFPQPMNDELKLLSESDGKIVIGANYQLSNEPMSDEEIAKAAEAYVDKYKDYRNVAANVRGPRDAAKKFMEHVYALTRESYNR